MKHDTISLSEFCEHGSINTTISKKAKGIIEANSLFLSNEVNWDDSASDFKSFLNKNIGAIYFDSLAEKFLITPLQKRKTVYKLNSVPSFGQMSAFLVPTPLCRSALDSAVDIAHTNRGE